MTATKKSKWYESKALLILLLFVLPPLGIIGIFKRNSVIWKKIAYILVGMGMSLFLLLCTIGLFYDVDYYKEGNKYYTQRNYTKAYEYFGKVEANNPNYNDAVLKMQEIKPIVDSLNLVEEQRKADAQKEKELLKEQEKSQKAKENEEIETSIGKEVSIGHFTYIVNDISFKKTIGESYFNEEADGIFLIVNLTILNTSDETRTLNGSLFYLTDKDDVKFEHSTRGSSILEMSGKKTLFLKECQPRIKTKGSLVFEVPEKGDYYLHLVGSYWGVKSTRILLK